MMNTGYIVNRSWAEIDLDALAANARYIKAQTRPECEVMGVVKADAYGHGALETAETLLENGFSRLAVSLLDEAIQLRRSGITAPILILSYTDPRRAAEIIEHRVTQTVYTWDLIDALETAGRRQGRHASVHIKLDTGMGRIGFTSGFGSVEEIRQICALRHVEIEGIFTHFSTSDEADRGFTDVQFSRFLTICSELEREGIYIPIKHCCNSAAILRYPEMHLDMVRSGIITYGILPGCCEAHAAGVRPVMQLKSNVIMVKDLPADEPVGYGRRFITPRETRIATVPIGYADGYGRIMSGRAVALIHGVEVPVVGSICMDACMMDVSAVPEPIQIGDEVVLCGTQHFAGRSAAVRAEQLADWQQTIAYEVLCIVGKRVPRVYMQSGQLVGAHSDVLT